jgi:glutamate racemase
MRNAAPIGVFDSGLGGLTVFKALSRRLPRENLAYFGDTAHVPYGSKSKEAVTRYSVYAARFLARRGIKALVVACNTSSALAMPELKKAVAVPVIGVIEAGAAAASAAAHKRVGVIGTEATINSGAYVKAIHARMPAAVVVSQPCPLFVPLVEEGWWDDEIALKTARKYLAPLRAKRVETLILGCTHYPMLKKVIQKVMGSKVTLVDSAEETAKETERLLGERGLLNDSKSRPKRTFFVTDAPERFKRLSRRFLGAYSGESAARLAPLVS